DVLSKTAVIELLRSPFGAEPPKGARAETIRKLFDKSSRPAASWMLVWLQLAEDPKDALDRWNKLIEAESALLQRSTGETNVDILSGLIRYQIFWLKKQGQTEQAIAAMRRLVDLEKGDLDTLVELLDWLTEQKAWKVIDELALRFAPQFSAEPILLYTLAKTQKDQGHEAKAEETAQRAFQLNAGNEELQLVRRYMIARRLCKHGLFTWAKREFIYIIDQSKAASPMATRAQVALAEMLHDQGENQEAGAVLEILFKSSGAKNPINVDAAGHDLSELRSMMYYYQACHWETSGDRAKQRDCLDKALAAESGDVDVLIACYRLPEQTPEFKQKITELIRNTAEDIREEIASDPENGALYNQLAWLIGNTEGNLDEAWKCSQKSLELSPDNPAFYDTLARVCYAKGDYENAVKNQHRAAELEPHSGLIARQLELFRKAAEEHKK
ncbi:MAG TPA: hypothetical protein VIH42_00800, partial [Thermoguttaceae bacterium]